jgi:hypothetical protein
MSTITINAGAFIDALAKAIVEALRTQPDTPAPAPVPAPVPVGPRVPSRQWYKVNDAAEVLGVADQLIYQELKRGDVPGARKMGRRWLVPGAWVEGISDGIMPVDRPSPSKKPRGRPRKNRKRGPDDDG